MLSNQPVLKSRHIHLLCDLCLPDRHFIGDFNRGCCSSQKQVIQLCSHRQKLSSNVAPLLCASCCDKWEGWEQIPGKSGWNYINRDAPATSWKGRTWDSFLSLTVISSSFPSFSRLFVSPGVSSIDSVGWTWIHSHHHRFSASLQQWPKWSFIAEITVWPKPTMASILEMYSLDLPLIRAWFFLLSWGKVPCLKPNSSAITPPPSLPNTHTHTQK